MSRPRNYQTEAIIIRKTKLGEADRILSLYTPGLGKIQAVAKGVRRPRSKLAGHLELLTHSLVSLVHGRNLDTIIGSQTINAFITLKSELEYTSCALYAAELVDQFTADGVEDQPLFELLRGTLERLCPPADKGLALRHFEIHLLERAGYRPQLQECVSCHSPLMPTTNYFSPAAGGTLCPGCRQGQPMAYTVPVNVLKVLRFLQANDYAAACKLRLEPELAGEVERVIRGYIRYLLEREVKSASWLDSLKKQGARVNPS